ncbi:hypothetical protein E2C01_046071 [Portunus trituberculatus]|uniref:Uncharacterized protein n=1 Tax=Portunus trituberculatus TaxID=210409 RepID=A0A5B7G4T8_PORTR|nr:hypothetical protein [Portunus trituberculatus]
MKPGDRQLEGMGSRDRTVQLYPKNVAMHKVKLLKITQGLVNEDIHFPMKTQHYTTLSRGKRNTTLQYKSLFRSRPQYTIQFNPLDTPLASWRTPRSNYETKTSDLSLLSALYSFSILLHKLDSLSLSLHLSLSLLLPPTSKTYQYSSLPLNLSSSSSSSSCYRLATSVPVILPRLTPDRHSSSPPSHPRDLPKPHFSPPTHLHQARASRPLPAAPTVASSKAATRGVLRQKPAQSLVSGFPPLHPSSTPLLLLFLYLLLFLSSLPPPPLLRPLPPPTRQTWPQRSLLSLPQEHHHQQERIPVGLPSSHTYANARTHAHSPGREEKKS